MNTVFEPSLIFISPQLWASEQNRDAFLLHFINNLRTVEEFDITNYYWSDCLECLLWESPVMPPWRLDKDWSNQLVPIIYNLFQKRIAPLDVAFKQLPPAQHIPDITASCPNQTYMSSFCSIMHYLITINESVFICLGLQQSNINDLSFNCNCHAITLQPTLIRRPKDWHSHVDITAKLWPNGNDTGQQNRLRRAIDLTVQQKFTPSSSIAIAFTFGDHFLPSLLQEINLRENILYAISKRLLMTQHQAASDAGLEDEPVRGKEGIRRFRVSGGTRIHYDYIKNGEIRFLCYFGLGCHDDGL